MSLFKDVINLKSVFILLFVYLLLFEIWIWFPCYALQQKRIIIHVMKDNGVQNWSLD